MHVFMMSVAVAGPDVSVRTLEHAGERYTVATVDLMQIELRLYGQGNRGRPRTFTDLERNLGPELRVATNAGIFHSPERPNGLFVDQGVERWPLSTAEGEGNFYLKPGGVFSIDATGAHVTDAATWTATATTRLATQSGPALLLDGQVHPLFDPESESLRLRSGVGVSDPWTVHLVVSEGGVRFHDFATLFRDELGCDDALFLDGTISGLWTDEQPPLPTQAFAGLLAGVTRAPATDVREGDIVVQRSTSEQSVAIAAATGSDWTHTGIVRIVDGEPWVLEATQPVKLTRYAVWVDRGVGDRVGVYRLLEAESAWTDAAVARLDALQAQWLGLPYDARFGWGDEALYCSELVYKAYQGAVGVELGPLHPIGSYDVADPRLREAMRQRWGTVPVDLQVVAPSDLVAWPGLTEVDPR
jgi:uncharacterized protein YigE (DUF2233 family)